MSGHKPISRLLDKVEARPGARERIARIRQEMEAESNVFVEREKFEEAFGMSPEEMLSLIRKLLPEPRTLAQLREDAAHLTQVQVAALLEESQPNVSRIESAADVTLSTLKSYIQALGGRIEIAAVFEEEQYLVKVG